jgi:hypothetical protein
MMRLYVCHAAPPWYAPADGAEAVKIGVSANPARRKWSLKRAGCEKPKLIWQSPEMPASEAYLIEAAIKRKLAHRCVGGTEWFNIRPDAAVRVCAKAARTGIAVRTLYRAFGAKGTPIFGRKKP